MSSRWQTHDGSPWWMNAGGISASGSPKYTSAAAYVANCYLDIPGKPTSADSITFKDNACNYHSKSYFCQPMSFNLAPKTGSPTSCTCKKVELAGEYSAQVLVKCEKCLDIYKSTDKNSCPVGTKLFSPRSRADWKTFLASATPLRSPNWIVDITRPQNGCGGCTNAAMNSASPQQATWQTSDGSAWWLRNAAFTQPNGDGYTMDDVNKTKPHGDYQANCFMNLLNSASEDAIEFDDEGCNFHSTSYYCQSVKTTTTTTPVPPPTPPPATPAPTPAPVDRSSWDLSGDKDFILKARVKTTAAGGTIVGKAFKDGLWKNGGGTGQGKMIFLRGGKFGMDIGWVGYFACSKKVNDGKWHNVALKYVKKEGNQYQLFDDDMTTPCKKGLRAVKDHPSLKVYIKKAIGHKVSNGVANGDMAPALNGEVTGISYKSLEIYSAVGGGYCDWHYKAGGKIGVKACADKCKSQANCKVFTYGNSLGCRYSACGSDPGPKACPADKQCPIAGPNHGGHYHTKYVMTKK